MSDAVSDVQRRNVELVKRALEVSEREGFAGLAAQFDAFFHPDFEWTPRMVGFGERTYRGREGFQEYVDDVTETVGAVSFTGSDVRAVGNDQVLALGRVRMVGRESGLPLEDEYAILYRLDVGRMVSARAFLSHAEAEEAVADA